MKPTETVLRQTEHAAAARPPRYLAIARFEDALCQPAPAQSIPAGRPAAGGELARPVDPRRAQLDASKSARLRFNVASVRDAIG